VEAQSRDRDALTGLGNRTEAFSLLRRDLAGGTAGAVILCDLDHFAAFNDSNGHHQGDRLLRLVATTLTRSGDGALSPEAYRIGGDEFLIRIPGAELHAAKTLAEEARRKIKLLPADLQALQPEDEPLTARFVVAAWREGQAPSPTILLGAAGLILGRPDTRDAVVSIDDEVDEGGGAGVREPRRPLPNAPSATDAVDPSA
jgi:diguanylate cyclase (GGDEF)-like protein